MGGLLLFNRMQADTLESGESHVIGRFDSVAPYKHPKRFSHKQDLDGERFGHDAEDGFYRNDYGDGLVNAIPLEGSATIDEEIDYQEPDYDQDDDI